MKEIVITYHVLSGNLGDGWRDELEAARAYAELLKDRLYTEAKAAYPDAKIDVRIDVQYAVGWNQGINAFGIDSDGDTVDLRDEFLEVPERAWQKFCGSEYRFLKKSI